MDAARRLAKLDRGFERGQRQSDVDRAALERRNPGFSLLEKIGSGGMLVEVAGHVLLNPDLDQVSADVMALGEPMKGLASQKLVSNLTLELDAVRAVLGHWPSSFESPGPSGRGRYCAVQAPPTFE
jgi:hypothetical protein